MKTQQQYDNIFDNLKLSSKFKKDINEYNLEDVIQLIDIGINESDDDFIFKVIKNYNDFSDKLKNLFMRIIHRRPYVKYVNLFLKHTDIDFSDGNYIIPRKIATYGYLNIFKRLMKEKNLVNEESLELYFSESCMEQYHIVKYLIDEFEFEINAKYNIFFALNCISRKKKMIKIMLRIIANKLMKTAALIIIKKYLSKIFQIQLNQIHLKVKFFRQLILILEH